VTDNNKNVYFFSDLHERISAIRLTWPDSADRTVAYMEGK